MKRECANGLSCEKNDSSDFLVHCNASVENCVGL